ncbi:IclR family transcriptional regulator [Chakrabartyella piscis]|uniref:IclR family transcriptional regulator n=1 Tax=Chakrabartyella piscis TaxID=2918914 RepID=UPI0029589042|nr:IclR family transcriptional regulator [Chakrabartyella piscis]
MKEPTENPIQVADRLFQTLELLATCPPMSLMELSQTLGLNKSTMHRILNSLVYMGYAKQENNSLKYTLTHRICELSNQFMHQTNIIPMVRPYLQELVNLSGETIHLVQMDQNSAIYIDKMESTQNSIRLVSKVGKSIPLYCSAVGKAMLANMGDDVIKEIWNNSDIRALTPQTIVDFKDFMNEIDRVRKNGYALDLEENELGVRCIAVAISNYQNQPNYAISISAPVTRMGRRRILELAEFVWDVKKRLRNELR